MEFKGEIFAIATSLLWTCTALCFEYSSKKAGALPINIIRLAMAFIMLLVLLFFTTGSPFPLFADKTTWMWLAISGLIGFVMGDFFLFNSYTLIGSRSTQLFMTLGTPFAVIAGVFILNQQLSLLSMAGICVTLSGIFISILGRENKIGRAHV